MGPAPITPSRRGRSVSEKTVSFVKIVDGVQTGNRRRGRSGAGGNHGAFEVHCRPIDVDRVGIQEASLPEVDIDSEITKTLSGVIGTDAGAQPAHTFHRGGKIDAHALRHVDPEFVCSPHAGRDASSTDNPLRGHATDIQAVATHQAAFDQGDFGPQSGRSRGCD